MGSDPVIPIGFEVLGWLLAIVYIGTLAFAIVTLSLSKGIKTSSKLSWLMIIIILPFLGSIMWISVYFRRYSRKKITTD